MLNMPYVQGRKICVRLHVPIYVSIKHFTILHWLFYRSAWRSIRRDSQNRLCYPWRLLCILPARHIHCKKQISVLQTALGNDGTITAAANTSSKTAKICRSRKGSGNWNKHNLAFLG